MKVVKENRRIDVRWVLHDDGKHEVTFGDQSLVVTAVETLARITYEETLVEHDPAKELRARSVPTTRCRPCGQSRLLVVPRLPTRRAARVAVAACSGASTCGA